MKIIEDIFWKVLNPLFTSSSSSMFISSTIVQTLQKQNMIYNSKKLCWRSPEKPVAHRAGGRDISNKCCFAACACDRPGPDKLWSMRKVWLTFRELSLWDICISEQIIHCNLFSHIYIYTYINTYIRLHINNHICIHICKECNNILPLGTYTVQLTVNTCLDKISLSVALMYFWICNLADFCRSYSTKMLL